MRIKKVLIENFRSINCSEEVNLDRETTVLIGRNEYGKTNFLKALQSFGTSYEYEEEDLCTYCAAKQKLEAGSLEEADVPIVTIWFQLEPDDKGRLHEVHEKLGQLEEIKVTKFFDGNYKVEGGKLDISELQKAAEISVKELSGWAETESYVESLRGQLDAHVERYPEFASSRPSYEERLAAFLELALEDNDQRIDEAFETLIGGLESLSNQDQPIIDTLSEGTNSLRELQQSLKGQLAEEREAQENVLSQVLNIMPSFIYFTDVDLLQDSVPLSTFLGNKEQYKTLNNLLMLATLDVDKLAQGSPYERRSATESASAEITGLVNTFWRQQKVTVSIAIDGDSLIIFVTDDIGAFDPPSRRSKGFQWFLSFYVNFTAGSKNELKNAILLLDDPGVYLHPLGQEDLKKTLEELAASNQLIMATHSPFMIYRDHLERVRIVDKQSNKGGTKLTEKFWVSNFDAIAPLRAALGIKLGEMPLASTRHLIVEGYEDLVYIEAMALYFKRTKKKPTIDLSKILILPVNGADKAPFYATFLLAGGFKFLVLLDHDQKGKAVKKSMVESQLIPEDQIVTMEQVVISEEPDRDYEIEDLFGGDFYRHAVTTAYQKEIDDGTIDLGDLDSSTNRKQTKRYHELFRKSRRSFDELRVAQEIRLLVDSPTCDDDLVGETTLSNFSNLFETIADRLK